MKNDYICAEDIVDIMATSNMKKISGDGHCTISIQTAKQWLKNMAWQYGHE